MEKRWTTTQRLPPICRDPLWKRAEEREERGKRKRERTFFILGQQAKCVNKVRHYADAHQISDSPTADSLMRRLRDFGELKLYLVKVELLKKWGWSVGTTNVSLPKLNVHPKMKRRNNKRQNLKRSPAIMARAYYKIWINTNENNFQSVCAYVTVGLCREWRG